MRNSIAEEIKKIAKKDKTVFVIGGDAGLGVWDDFKDSGQFINPGINEQFDIGFGVGLALEGHKVIYYNIIPFVIMRPYEFVRNDICYQEVPFILIGTGSGITYAPAGHTHYALEDITLALSMPGLNIFSPADPVEAVECFRYAYKTQSPCYIRLARNGEKVIHKSGIDITKPQFLHKSESEDVLILHGSVADEVDGILEEVEINVISVPFLNSGFEWNEFLRRYRYVFTLEEHFVNGGFGSYLNDMTDKKIHKFGIKNEYVHKIGNRDYLRKYYGIDAKSVAEKIKRIRNGQAS